MDQQTLLIIGILGAFFVFTILPQFTQRRKRQQELSAIQVGDWVVTIGGIIGQVMALSQSEVRLRISAAGELTLVRQAIRGKIEVRADFAADEEGSSEEETEEEDEELAEQDKEA